MVKAVISRVKNILFCFIFNDNKLQELHNFESTDIGNIYVARIQNYVKDLNSAFVDVGHDSGIYLLNPVESNLVDGDKIKNGAMYLCQLKKEAHNNKQAEVQSKIEINNEYVVITFGGYGIKISKKIQDKDSVDRLKKIAGKYKSDGYEILIRTSAVNLTDEELETEIQNEFDMMNEIISKAKVSKNPSLLHRQAKILDRLRIADEIVTDDHDIYNELKNLYQIRYYDDEYPITNIFGLDNIIDSLKKRKVYLNNGADIVIEHTEALTVIDVNSSKGIIGNKGIEFFDINEAACIEIVRQLMIRNISGIILIDFINMKSESERKKLMDILKNELKKDYNKSVIYGFTKLGLLEMSRSRKNKMNIEYLGR